jgi:hypothetical protein
MQLCPRQCSEAVVCARGACVDTSTDVTSAGRRNAMIGGAAGVVIQLPGTDEHVVACPSFDEDGSDTVTVAELIRAVNDALAPCRPMLLQHVHP